MKHQSGPTDAHVCVAFAVALASHMNGSRDRHRVCREAAEAVLRGPTPRLYKLYARWALGLLAAVTGDGTAAAEQYADLCSSPKAPIPLFADRLLGLVASTMGQWENAAGHFEGALAFCRSHGLHPDVAWSCHDYAEMLLKRNSVGDRRRANELLDEALYIGRELGMRPLMERVLARREILSA